MLINKKKTCIPNQIPCKFRNSHTSFLITVNIWTICFSFPLLAICPRSDYVGIGEI